MGAVKRAFHEEILWNSLDDAEKAETLNSLTASRKADRETLADILTMIATLHGATVERQGKAAVRGFGGQSIDLRITCKGVGAMIDIGDLHGGEWVLISWFNDRSYPSSLAPRSVSNFTREFFSAVKDGGNGRPHHKATSHPRDWYSLAMMLDRGLQLAVRGAAFEEPSAA